MKPHRRRTSAAPLRAADLSLNRLLIIARYINAIMHPAELMHQLLPHPIAKPWGRDRLPDWLGDVRGERIGEVIFTGGSSEQQDLLVKYILTSERLSIQVHPDDATARREGHAHGKDEAWYILDCKPGATIGLGFREAATQDDVRAAIAAGMLEKMIDWRPVFPGEFYMVPAGTVHAIGADIMLVEVQCNADITYRLYDYGRDRPLHVEQALACARLERYALPVPHIAADEERELLTAGHGPFGLRHVAFRAGEEIVAHDSCAAWFVPLEGTGSLSGAQWKNGECWILEAGDRLYAQSDGSALIAVPNANSKMP
ncbi:mannose-6-phosphate isomerase [Sphingobium wenxiniae]|uniref:Mannose-6-phosphate isomerase n=2 Tax=Sphingomonadaceae TaxID=41297 RepID=A0A562KBQ7_SPHWJ|nr:mannose-6-phosphate isomerase [Sphingobium wenxiniae]